MRRLFTTTVIGICLLVLTGCAPKHARIIEEAADLNPLLAIGVGAVLVTGFIAAEIIEDQMERNLDRQNTTTNDADNFGSVICSERYCHCELNLHCDDGLYCSDKGWCDKPVPKEQCKENNCCGESTDCPRGYFCDDAKNCVTYYSREPLIANVGAEDLVAPTTGWTRDVDCIDGYVCRDNGDCVEPLPKELTKDTYGLPIGSRCISYTNCGPGLTCEEGRCVRYQSSTAPRAKKKWLTQDQLDARESFQP